MFRGITKLAVVEGLNDAFDSSYPDELITPRYIGVDWPMSSEKWPALLVELDVSKVSWSGIDPDYYEVSAHPDFSWEAVRMGLFQGSFAITILALSSGEIDRLWDQVAELFMMGTLTAQGRKFHNKVNDNEYVAMTLQTTQFHPIDSAPGKQVPWDPNALSYEASLSFPVVGQFYSTNYSTDLLSLSGFRVLPYRADEDVPLDSDGDGTWSAP